MLYEHQIGYDHHKARRSVYAPALLEKIEARRRAEREALRRLPQNAAEREARRIAAEKAKGRETEAEKLAMERIARSREKTLAANIPGVTKAHKELFLRLEAKACAIWVISPVDLRSHSRVLTLSLARQFVAYWMARRTTLSLPQVGALLGRDHTTILHAMLKYPLKRARQGRHLKPARDSRTDVTKWAKRK